MAPELSSEHPATTAAPQDHRPTASASHPSVAVSSLSAVQPAATAAPTASAPISTPMHPAPSLPSLPPLPSPPPLPSHPPHAPPCLPYPPSTSFATSPPPEEPQHIPPPPHATAAQLSPPLREAWLPPNHEGEASVRSSHEGEAAGPSSHEEQPCRPPIPEREAAPQRKGEAAASPQRQGEAAASPQRKGEAAASPQRQGEAAASPQRQGEAAASPQRQGEAAASPQRQGEAAASPQRQGEAAASPQRQGEAAASPQRQGEAAASPTREGEPSASPQRDGEAAYPKREGEAAASPKREGEAAESPDGAKRARTDCEAAEGAAGEARWPPQPTAEAAAPGGSSGSSKGSRGKKGKKGTGLSGSERSIARSGGRAITRGVVPAINAELELLTSDAPTIVTNPALTGSRSEERTESQWEEALHLLDGHALPHYILVDWWGTIDRCLCDAAAARSFAEEGEGTSRLGEAESLAAQWHAALRELLLRLRRQGEAEDVSFDALLLLLRQGFEAHRAEVERCTPLRGHTKPELQRSNLAHQAAAIAARVQAELERAYSKQCVRLARALKLDSSAVEGGKALRRKLEQVMRLGEYRDYALMTKLAYNELVGQKRLWAAGEREALLCSLCTRNDAHGAPRVWITKDFFFQHTDQNAGEVHVLVYLPRMEIQALVAVADFQPPWTAGQFHHMAHACQEDRMFFLGRKSERDFAPKVTYDMSNSFEGGSRWTSHFHMPTLLAVDIICAKPGVRGLGLLLLAHVCCLQSSFTNTRTHILFDISGRESNVRMIRFTQSVGAQRCQTFADEARSTGFIGVEGDDPRIFWTHKAGSSYGPNDGKTSGVYAVDVETNEAIGPSHPAVLFDDRVTQHDFYRGGRNCSYFAVSPIEVAQAKLTGLLEEMRVRLEAGAAQQWSAQFHSTAQA